MKIHLYLNSQHNISSVIAHNLGRQYEYKIIHPSSDESELKLYVSVSVSESNYIIEQRLLFKNIEIDLDRFKTLSKFLPSDPRIEKIIHNIENSKSKSCTATISSTYDDKCRIKSITGKGNAFGIDIDVEGFVDHKGFHATATSKLLGLEETIEERDFNPDNIHGLTPLLPSDIKPGDIVKLTPFNQQLQLEVGPFENTLIHHTQISLMHCSLNRDLKKIADVYANENGVVYVIRVSNTGAIIKLQEVKLDNGDVIWSLKDEKLIKEVDEITL